MTSIAQKLLLELKKTNGGWIDNFADIIFEKPEYPIDREINAHRRYWQWCADMYNTSDTRPVGSMLTFETFVGSKNYSKQISSAYQELKKLGLADEKNNGYNEYFIYATN